MQSRFKLALLGGVAVASLAAGVQSSFAGAFALREQSAYGQGMSFAGAAANGAGLGSMFWNPATMTSYAGWQGSWNISGIVPSAEIAPTGGTLGALPSSTIGVNAVIPASYQSYQYSDKIWFGMSVNASYGLMTKSRAPWAGQFFGLTSQASSTDVSPSIAYKVNDMISVAAGVRVMHFGARFTSLIPPAGAAPLILQGTSWGLGFTAGVTLKPIAGTEIGIGYRSQVRQPLSGTTFIGAPTGITTPAGTYNIKANVNLPDSFTIGLKQRVTDQFTLLAGFEWTRWSVFNSFPITCTSGPGVGCPVPRLDFFYRDGWFASLGGEYQWSPNLKLRAGWAYERAPISDTVRGVRLPDNDRIWASLGASYQASSRLSIDVGYTHIYAARSTPITITSVANPAFLSPALTLTGTFKSNVDIVSIGVNYRFDEPVRAVVAKY